MGELKLGQFYPSVHVQRHLVKLISQLMILMIKLVMLMIIVSSQFYPLAHGQRHLVRLISQLMTAMLTMRIIILMIIMFMK